MGGGNLLRLKLQISLSRGQLEQQGKRASAMEQGVPGSQNEHFFELLHPNAARGPPPPPPPPPPSSSVDAAAEESPVQDPPPLYDIPPSYDFQLTHSSEPSMSGDVGAKLEDSPNRGPSLTSSGDDHHHVFRGSTNDTTRGHDHGKPVEVMETCNQVTMDAIDHTIKNYTDNLLHVLQNVSERLSQLENTVQGLEHTIAGLKSAEGEKLDQSNSRLLKLELLIAEVHTGVQLLHDKQKLDEAKSHLTKLHIDDQKSAIGGVPQTSADGWQQPRLAKEEGPHVAFSEPPPQLLQHQPPQYPPQAQSLYPHALPPPPPQMQAFTTSQNMLPLPPSMNGPSNHPATQQTYPSTMQHLSSQPSAQQLPPQHSMQVTSFHSQPAPQPPAQSSYNLPMETAAYGHIQPQHHHPAPPTPPSSTYQPEPPQYSGGTHGGPRQQPLPSQEMLHLPQQQNPAGSQHMYDGRMGPTASSMAPSYAQPPLPKPAPQVPMYEATSGGGYVTTPYKAGQPVPSAPTGGGGGYPRLPTAQPLQHGSGGPSIRSPLDEVIERVVAMGFSREQVRGVVRQLTENGQSVDMNVVLDKLMNGGDSSQPPRGWFRG